MKVRTTCPGCSTRYVLPSEGIPAEGRRVACRHCGRQWTIPHPGAQAAPRGSTPAQARPAPGADDGGAKGIVRCPHCEFHYPASAARPIETDRRVILLAEDQNFFRTIIREALGEGFRFVVGRNVEEAKAVLASVPVHLLVLDLNLEEPGDGEQVLAALPDGVPALVLTGDQDPDLYGERWEHLQQLGATDLLIKGLNIREQIAVKVESLLDRQRATG